MNNIVRKVKRALSLLILSVMVLTMVIPTAYAQSATATDIQSHWAYKEISSWIEQGFAKVNADGTFKPDQDITRGEFAAYVNRSFGFTEKASISFTDVKESHAFYGDLAIAKKAGYLNGSGDGTVRPDATISRQEVAIIIARLKSLQENAAEAGRLADAAKIPTWSKGFIGAIVKAKVMNGFPDGSFGFLNNMTRAQAIVTLNRLLSVKIEAIKDQTATVNATTVVAVKVLTADAKIAVQSSDDKVVQATLSGTNIQLKGMKAGTATITVTGKKDGLQDIVVTFKVVVSAAVVSTGSSSGGGGGGGSHSGGGGTPVVTPTPPPVVTEDDSKLTSVQAIGTVATAVTGNYANGVTKVEVIYNSITKTATLNADGTFTWSIFPGLPLGTDVTVKGYVGTQLKDTDVVKVGAEVENPAISDVSAVGTVATAVTGKYDHAVTNIEVLYNSLTKPATLNADETFTWSIFPGLASGTTVTVKAYKGTQLALTVTVVTAGTPVEGPMITELKAVGTVATAVTGKCNSAVTKIEVLYNSLIKPATLNTDGTFTWSIFPGLASGTTVTVKAYIGTQLKETKTVVTEGTPVEGPTISDVKAVGNIATAISGNYVATVTKVEVIYSGVTKLATLNADGTFTWSIFPGLASGTNVVVKAYVGEVLKDTVSVSVL